MAERRAEKQFDPRLVALLVADAEKVFNDIDELGSWDAVIDEEPALAVVLSPDECDAALAAIARFVDLKSPWRLGHSGALADLAVEAGRYVGATDDELRALRRASLVTGYGTLGVSNAIWDKAGPLTASEWERVRRAPHLTERMLHQSEALAPTGRLAALHRERLDGSGYPRGLAGPAISRAGRILAAADAYQAMREPRPHRAAKSADDAARELRTEVRNGTLDATAVDAVLRAAGHKVARRHDGAGRLTAREVEVLRLLARGMSNKEIAAQLVITPKTVGNHVEHIYTKIGASNRAAAGLFAMQHGLLPEPHP